MEVKFDGQEPETVPTEAGYFEVTKGLKIAVGGLLIFVLINLAIIMWMRCSMRQNNVREKGLDELSEDTENEALNLAQDVANANESEVSPINIE